MTSRVARGLRGVGDCRSGTVLAELDEGFVERLTYDDVANVEATEDVARDYFSRMKEMIGGE